MFNSDEIQQITNIAQEMQIEPAAMIALGLKESSGNVFWTVDGQQLPAIRPETHHFHRLLQGEERRRAVAEGLAHPKRKAIKMPRSWSGVYRMYRRMQAINPEAAAAATSHGWGQVMGFNHEDLGYDSAVELAERAAGSLEGQTELVARFLEANGLIPAMNALPKSSAAKLIARRYNGPAYRENRYDTDLIKNYRRVVGNTSDPTVAEGRSILDLQKALIKLGFEPGKADNINGNMTKAAVRQFQKRNGLIVDGIAGSMTWEALEEQLKKKTEVVKAKVANVSTSGLAGIGGVVGALEAVEFVRGLQTDLTEVATGFGLTEPILSVVVGVGVAYFIYMKYFKSTEEMIDEA